jgi:hypothetical protein
VPRIEEPLFLVAALEIPVIHHLLTTQRVEELEFEAELPELPGCPVNWLANRYGTLRKRAFGAF